MPQYFEIENGVYTYVYYEKNGRYFRKVYEHSQLLYRRRISSYDYLCAYNMFFDY